MYCSSMTTYLRTTRAMVGSQLISISLGTTRSGAGRSAHSPRSCLPGGGWRIDSIDRVEVPNVKLAGQPVRVNRALIQLGESRQLVYYFFKQRQRILTSEYVVKWYLMWDALTQKRTDGALVRLIVPLAAGEAAETGDARLASFLAKAAPQLHDYLPD